METSEFKEIKALLLEHANDVHLSRTATNELIEATIIRVVNGKIDNLTKKLDAFVLRADPAVIFFEHITWSKKFILALLTFFGIMISLVLGLKNLIK